MNLLKVSSKDRTGRTHRGEGREEKKEGETPKPRLFVPTELSIFNKPAAQLLLM